MFVSLATGAALVAPQARAATRCVPDRILDLRSWKLRLPKPTVRHTAQTAPPTG